MHTAVPHHDGSPLYVSTASPQLGEVVRLRVRVPEGFGPVRSVRVRSNPDHEPRFWDAAIEAIPRTGSWFPRVESHSDGRLVFRLRSAPEPKRAAVLATWGGPALRSPRPRA